MTDDQLSEVLVLEGLSKTFEGQRALDEVSLEVGAGEIHALLGQNGSGKSTLVKLLAGYHRPTAVTRAELHREPFELGSASAARAGGLHFIHQDLGLVGSLDTVDNLGLGAPYAGRLWLSDRRERRAARELCERYGLSIDVAVPVGALSRAQQTMVAIVRALRDGAGPRTLLVLDEPTVSFADQEVGRLFELLREVQAQGAAVLYITHRLAEVFEIADCVTVLRDGRQVGTRPTRELDHDKLLHLILGRSLPDLYPLLPKVDDEVVLKVEDLRGRGVRTMSLEVHKGETLGVTGLVGSGYDEMLRVIFDADERLAGNVTMNRRLIGDGGIRSSIRSGLGYASADRQRFSGIREWTLRENLTLPALRTTGLGAWLGTRSERRDAATWLDRLGVSPSDPERPFASLSGGNQQKVVLGRWLRCGAKAYLLDEPTSGVDIGAKHAIYEALVAAAASGAAVLLSSSDSEELCAICDRVIVMRQGAIAAVLHGRGLTVEAIRRECASEADVAPRIGQLAGG